jgi:hypothetical protein
LVLSDSDGFNEPATLSYDPLKGMAYGKHTYSKVYATGVDEITVIYKLYFTRENGGITMTGVGSQTINGNPAGSWSYNEKRLINVECLPNMFLTGRCLIDADESC